MDAARCYRWLAVSLGSRAGRGMLEEFCKQPIVNTRYGCPRSGREALFTLDGIDGILVVTVRGGKHCLLHDVNTLFSNRFYGLLFSVSLLCV